MDKIIHLRSSRGWTCHLTEHRAADSLNSVWAVSGRGLPYGEMIHPSSCPWQMGLMGMRWAQLKKPVGSGPECPNPTGKGCGSTPVLCLCLCVWLWVCMGICSSGGFGLFLMYSAPGVRTLYYDASLTEPTTTLVATSQIATTIVCCSTIPLIFTDVMQHVEGQNH